MRNTNSGGNNNANVSFGANSNTGSNLGQKRTGFANPSSGSKNKQEGDRQQVIAANPYPGNFEEAAALAGDRGF